MQGRTILQYELTITLLIDSPHDKGRVARQTESLFEFGTINESFADALGLDENPQRINISIEKSAIGCHH